MWEDVMVRGISPLWVDVMRMGLAGQNVGRFYGR